ncbi:MAG TPA: hypothetical protein VF665_20500 [Longimicrobium sp.]|jgi:hypothetical protein
MTSSSKAVGSSAVPVPAASARAAAFALAAGTGCALVGVAAAGHDPVEILPIVAVWAAVIGIAALVWPRRGLLALWALLGPLWVVFAADHHHGVATWYLGLLLEAPDAFEAWSLFAIPLAAASWGPVIRPGARAGAGASAWLALYGVSTWIAAHAPDVGGGPRHTPPVVYGLGAAWLLWPVLVSGWHLRRGCSA